LAGLVRRAHGSLLRRVQPCLRLSGANMIDISHGRACEWVAGQRHFAGRPHGISPPPSRDHRKPLERGHEVHTGLLTSLRSCSACLIEISFSLDLIMITLMPAPNTIPKPTSAATTLPSSLRSVSPAHPQRTPAHPTPWPPRCRPIPSRLAPHRPLVPVFEDVVLLEHSGAILAILVLHHHFSQA
jgi:hypothetical protein